MHITLQLVDNTEVFACAPLAGFPIATMLRSKSFAAVTAFPELAFARRLSFGYQFAQSVPVEITPIDAPPQHTGGARSK